jgi:nucleotide-binding universal stress UspA family protein
MTNVRDERTVQETAAEGRSNVSTKAASIVVGVDGSERNQAAVLWASHEAEDTGQALVLASAVTGSNEPLAAYAASHGVENAQDETRRMLQNLRDRLTSQHHDEIGVLIGVGSAAHAILVAAEHATMVVVGKRGVGAVKRMLVGSTSIAVAGRSPVPVVVVPDRWVHATRATAPIVVGVDPDGRNDAAVGFAFARADAAGVPLIAVSAWQIPAAYAWAPDDIDHWRDVAEADLVARLESCQRRYPEVEVVKLVQRGQTASVVLDASEIAQMIVLGRHTGPDHFGGLSFSSTARGVLHYADCPVAVVPDQQVASQQPRLRWLVGEGGQPDLTTPLY